MAPASDPGLRPLTVLVWCLVAVVLLIGVWKTTHLNGPSHDQNVLIEKSKSH